MVSSLDVELAMSLLQLTAVSLPLYLGLARYYLQNRAQEQREYHLQLVVTGASFLGTLLVIPAICAVIIFLQHENSDLFFGVLGYTSFLLVILILTPTILTSSTEKTGLLLIWGFLLAFLTVSLSGIIFILLQ